MSDFRIKYRELNGAYGNSIRENKINSMKSKINDSFTDSPSYYSVNINNSLTPSDVWIVDDSDSKDIKQIQTKPNSSALNVGDLIKWGNNYWLVLIVDDMGGVYYRGSMQLCNTSLVIQGGQTETQIGVDPHTGEPVIEYADGLPVSYPCIAEKTVLRASITTQPIYLPENRIKLTMKYFDFTEKTIEIYGEQYTVNEVDTTNVVNGIGTLTILGERVVL